MATTRAGDYYATYWGQLLLKNNNMDQHGVWEVFGEDGDSTNGPLLGVFEGTLKHVVEYAVQLDQFYTYGHGGRISKIAIKKITENSSKIRRNLATKLANLKSEADKLELQLANL